MAPEEGKSAANDIDNKRLLILTEAVRDIQGFEKLLTKLVASSFVFSGLTAVAQANKLTGDPASVATASALATIGGVAGALTQIIRWTHPPHEQSILALNFDARKQTGKTFAEFAGGAALFFVFFVGARGNMLWSPLAAAAASFVSFSALTRGAMIARTADLQQALWAEMSIDRRRSFLIDRHEREQIRIEHQKAVRELLEETRKFTEETNASLKKTRDDMKKFRRERRIEKIREIRKRTLTILAAPYQWSIKLRLALCGERCLFPFEVLKLDIEKYKGEVAFENLDLEMVKDDYESLKKTDDPGIRIENTPVIVYKGRWGESIILPENTDARAADSIVSDIRGHIDKSKPDRLYAVVPPGATITADALEVLAEFGLDVIQVVPLRKLAIAKKRDNSPAK